MTDLFEQSSQKLDAAITEIQNAIATANAAFGNMNAARNNPISDGTSLRSPVFSGRVDYSKGEFNGWGSAIQYGKLYNNVFLSEWTSTSMAVVWRGATTDPATIAKAVRDNRPLRMVAMVS